MNTENNISPFNDLGFKKCFASEEHTEVLAGLIHDFFGFEPKRIRITNPYDIKSYIEKLKNGEEYSVLRQTLRDVTAQLETADFTVEIQVKKNLYYDRRSTYYASSAFCRNYNVPLEEDIEEEIAAVSKYKSLRPVYSLNIMDAKYFKDVHPLRIFRLYDPERGLSMEPSYINIGYFEPRKTIGEMAEGVLSENQLHWRDHFLGNAVSMDAPSHIREAVKLLEYINMTKEEQDMIDLAERARVDAESELWTAKYEGKQEGIQDAARGMKKLGADNAFIAKATGLPVREIEKL